MELIQSLLNSIVARLGVEQSVEVLLDEIQRTAYVAGYTRFPDAKNINKTAHENFEDWQYAESLKNIPAEAVSASNANA
jgi:hypothetical protein